MERLTQERMGVLAPDHVKEIPRPVGEHNAVDLGVVLNGPKELVEGISGLAAGLTRRRSARLVPGLCGGPHAQRRHWLAGGRRIKGDRPEFLRLAAPYVLNPPVVAVQDFQDGQRLRPAGSSAAMWKAGARAITVWKPT